MTDKYAVIGGPQVISSLSPMIHRAFAQQTHQALDYEAIPIEDLEIDLEKKLIQLQQQGFKGLNVTAPFKESVYRIFLKRHATLSPHAQMARSVNMVSFINESEWSGEITDGIGLVRDLTNNLNWIIEKKTILICGAGGAVRGILQPLITSAVKKIYIANRTFEKAKILEKEFKSSEKVFAKEYQALDFSFDLIINAISNQQIPELSEKVFTPSTWCYDLTYKKDLALTPFLSWLKERGLGGEKASGIGMLVEQAAESFYIWRNIFPETKSVIGML